MLSTLDHKEIVEDFQSSIFLLVGQLLWTAGKIRLNVFFPARSPPLGGLRHIAF
jgi:hypothetical protein